MGLRRTITFPERELLEELERLQEHFDIIARDRDLAEAKLAIAVEALDKIQNCEIEINEGEVTYYTAPDARDLAILMASRALDEINQVREG